MKRGKVEECLDSEPTENGQGEKISEKETKEWVEIGEEMPAVQHLCARKLPCLCTGRVRSCSGVN